MDGRNRPLIPSPGESTPFRTQHSTIARASGRTCRVGLFHAFDVSGAPLKVLDCLSHTNAGSRVKVSGGQLFRLSLQDKKRSLIGINHLRIEISVPRAEPSRVSSCMCRGNVVCPSGCKTRPAEGRGSRWPPAHHGWATVASSSRVRPPPDPLGP